MRVSAARVTNLGRYYAGVFPSADVPNCDRESAAQRHRKVAPEDPPARRMPMHEMAEAEHHQRRERRQQQRGKQDRAVTGRPYAEKVEQPREPYQGDPGQELPAGAHRMEEREIGAE